MTDESLLSNLWQLLVVSGRRPKTPEALHAWIHAVLGFKIPRVAVCPDHQAPFTFVSDMFFRKVQRALVLAARGAGKTRNLAILNLLASKFYPGSGTAHYGAIGSQGEWGHGYLVDMLKEPALAADIARNVAGSITWKNGSWVRALSGHTPTGVTAIRCNRLIMDEIDLWSFQNFETAQLMLSGSKANPPQRAAISTRYTAYGLMQELLPIARARGYKTYRWCLWETMQRCETCLREKCPLFVWTNPRTNKKEPLCGGRCIRADGWVRRVDAIDEYLSSDAETFLVQKLLAAPEREMLIFPRFSVEVHASRLAPEVAKLRRTPQGVGVDWGFDHPLVFVVAAELPGGRYWLIEERGERFCTPSRELEIAVSLADKYGWDTPFFCPPDQPSSLAAFAEAGLVVVPLRVMRREERHRLVRRLIDPDKGPLLQIDREACPTVAQQFKALHRNTKGLEVKKLNDFSDAAEHVLAEAARFGGIQAGGALVV